MFNRRRRRDGRLRVLVSDIDGTLLDEGNPTRGLAELGLTVDESRDRDLLRLVYATGRTFLSTWALVAGGVLPQPDAVAAQVGTELWLPPWTAPDIEYHSHVSRGWSRPAVLAAVEDLPGLTLQEPRRQTRVKVSFYASDPALEHEVAARVEASGVDARVVYSGGRFLDVLPARAGKASAVYHLLLRWGVPRTAVLAAGDSGNDLDMLADPDFRAVAVGNSQPELRQLEEDETVHLARSSFAAGVLEGGEAHGFWPEST